MPVKTEASTVPTVGRAKRERVPPRAVTDGETVLATADIAMTPEPVFRALNTDEVESWWGSDDTYHMTNWAADLRVGGPWSVVPRTADGSTTPTSGHFLEIEAPGKIVFTRKYDWDFLVLGRRDTTVTYLFQPMEAGTRVTIRQEWLQRLV
jgi:uncharacterized protein YndB with AHSA1/START domain